MSIHQGHPPYLDFIKNEIKTLRFLFTNAFIAMDFRNLSQRAEYAYYAYKQKGTRILRSSTFEFESEFDILIENDSKKVIIESIVVHDFSLATYVLSIIDQKKDPPLIRKFHFDYAIPSETGSPKPVYHFQYGGKPSPGLNSRGINVAHLHPWLSVPRITSQPINLALLLDMVFCEFRSDITYKIIERPAWRNLIKENEDVILRPFYNRIRGFLNTHTSHSLIRDFYYGN